MIPLDLKNYWTALKRNSITPDFQTLYRRPNCGNPTKDHSGRLPRDQHLLKDMIGQVCDSVNVDPTKSSETDGEHEFSGLQHDHVYVLNPLEGLEDMVEVETSSDPRVITPALFSFKHNEVFVENMNRVRPQACSYCKQTFSRKDNLLVHTKILHSVDSASSSTFKCPQCPGTFTTTTTLIRHITRIHRKLLSSPVPAVFDRPVDKTTSRSPVYRDADVSVGDKIERLVREYATAKQENIILHGKLKENGNTNIQLGRVKGGKLEMLSQLVQAYKEHNKQLQLQLKPTNFPKFEIVGSRLIADGMNYSRAGSNPRGVLWSCSTASCSDKHGPKCSGLLTTNAEMTRVLNTHPHLNEIKPFNHDVEVVKSRNGNVNIVYKGSRFYIDKHVSLRGTRWRCTRCNSGAVFTTVVDGGMVVCREVAHGEHGKKCYPMKSLWEKLRKLHEACGPRKVIQLTVKGTDTRQKAELIRNSRGASNLQHSGYTYHANSTSRDAITWNCGLKKCKGQCVTNGGITQLITLRKHFLEHNGTVRVHAPDVHNVKNELAAIYGRARVVGGRLSNERLFKIALDGAKSDEMRDYLTTHKASIKRNIRRNMEKSSYKLNNGSHSVNKKETQVTVGNKVSVNYRSSQVMFVSNS